VSIYLYGLVLGSSTHLVPAHITGLGASSVRVVPCDALAALVSTLDRRPERANLDDIRAHDRALQSIVHHGCTAAAVRFGQIFGSDDEMRRHLGERGERLARLLEEHDGCVEMRLLLADVPELDEPTAPLEQATGPGRAYLERLKGASQQRLENLGLYAALGPVVRAERVEGLGNRGVVFSHLIRRSDEGDYRTAVAALPALATAVVVGPLALYSFAEPSE
jgi:hypothetical protein